MFEQVVSKNTRKILGTLAESKILKDAYLAGGTSLALQLGHRISVDLDFFTPKKFDVDFVLNHLNTIVDFRLDRRDWQTIIGSIEKTKFSLFYYEYKLIEETNDYLGIKLAGISDIAAMKLNAIADRGLKRDFIDLYFILQDNKLTLEEILNFYDKKYTKLAANKLHILKSLTYFADADPELMPKMLINISWNDVKKELIKKVKKIVR